MVCTLRSQRMAALARLQLNPQTIADEFANQNVAVQYIHRELREADEANLIDEKDMHIFDLRPMTDPLHLVCCNACKKPIKASQYAMHAELCSSLAPTEEIGLELDGGTGPKKPPRKDRKKLLAVNSNQITSIEGDKFGILDASDISAAQSHLETPSSEAKDCPAVLDGLRNGPRDPNCLGSAMPRSRKRSKMTKAEGPPPILGHFEAANGVISQGTLPCREPPRRSTPENQMTTSRISMRPRQLDEFCMISKDVPVPLATKIYYSRGNNPLRTALSHLYHDASNREHPNQNLNDKVFQPNETKTLATSANSFLSESNC